MKPEFEIGDIVKCIDSDGLFPRYNIGTIGTIGIIVNIINKNEYGYLRSKIYIVKWDKTNFPEFKNNLAKASGLS